MHQSAANRSSKRTMLPRSCGALIDAAATAPREAEAEGGNRYRSRAPESRPTSAHSASDPASTRRKSAAATVSSAVTAEWFASLSHSHRGLSCGAGPAFGSPAALAARSHWSSKSATFPSTVPHSSSQMASAIGESREREVHVVQNCSKWAGGSEFETWNDEKSSGLLANRVGAPRADAVWTARRATRTARALASSMRRRGRMRLMQLGCTRMPEVINNQ